MFPRDALSGTNENVLNYRILEKLGAGGMGVVYKAYDAKLDRTVALKFLPPDIQADEKNKLQFLREARAASALDHPNIGTIHTIEETPDGVTFIVMAYYEGETLSQRIRRSPLPKAQAIPIAIQMARGLAEAHAHQIVHRDIKPSNVILTRQGMAKIVDFGLARAIQTADSTATSGISGTVNYMSPEQALGKPLDQRTDLWSLGVVLCEMFSGQHPFDGPNTPAILFAVVNNPPEHVQNLPADVQPIVYRALSKDRAQRYETAEQMAADLEKIDVADERTATRTLAAGMAQYVESASRSLFQAQAAPSPKKRWPIAVAAGALLLAGSLLVIPSIRQRIEGSSEKHVAVLPFTGAGSENLADGLMETLTSRLSNLEGRDKTLWVVPASEVRRHKVTDPATAQKELGATLVVTGSIQRNGQEARLIVNLVDAKRMRQLGSEEIEDRTGDFNILQDSAVQKLARLMNVTIPGNLPGPSGGAVSAAAYESYLKAVGLTARWDKPGNLDQAVDLYEQAVKTDPAFALAFAGLGEAYLLKFKTDNNSRWLEQAMAACRRSVQINDQLVPVHVTLGRIHIEMAQVDLASQEFQKALDLDRRNPDALFGLAAVYEKQSRLKEAEETFVRAAALRPDFWDGFAKLGLFYYRQRRFDDAALRFRKVVELTPDNATGWLNLAASLRGAGKLDEAVDALQRSIRISPSYPAYTNLGNVYFQRQRFAEAAQQYEKAVALNDKDFRVWNNLGNAYVWINENDKAKAAYLRAIPLLAQSAKMNPRDAVLQGTLGALYAKVHDRTQAITHLDAARALAPETADVIARQAEIHEALGERSQAVQSLKQAIAAGYSLASVKTDAMLHRVLEDPSFDRKQKQLN